MAVYNNRRNKQTAVLSPKAEFINALHPLRRVAWIKDFIKKVEQPQMNMPKGKNANVEKFILGLSLCLCLFMKNYASLMRYGKPLQDYTNKYAAYVPTTQAPLVKSKLSELITRHQIIK